MEIRPSLPDDLRTFVELDAIAFGWGPVEEAHLEVEREVFRTARGLVAGEGGTAVGTTLDFDMELTVPGPRPVGVAAVSFVSVLPAYRRRGVLTSLMRRQLADIRERGVPLAILYASEAPIYGRFGYGVATWEGRVEIERHRARFARPAPAGRLRHVASERAEAEMGPVWDRVRRVQPGMVGVGPEWWRRLIAQHRLWREGMTEPRLVACDVEGEDGCLVYQMKSEWSGGQPAGRLEVLRLVATGSRAYRALWEFCLGMDLVTSVVAHRRPPWEPLRLMLADARAVRTETDDGLWLRLVDVPAALEARGYAAEGRLVISVRDSFCPWNEGVYELVVESGRGRCARSEEEPHLAAEVAALGAVYLGGNSFAELAAAGLVEELRDGALARADSMLATAAPPWSGFGF